VTKGLNVRRAEVAGQVLPGTAQAWVLPDESVYPGLPYVIVPDDLGDSEALAKVIEKLRAGRGADETDEVPDGWEGEW
jgi:hypothetical protein